MTDRTRTLVMRLGPLCAVIVGVVWVAAGGFRAGVWRTGRIDETWNAFTASIDSPVLHGIAQAFAVIGAGVPALLLVLALGVVVGLRRGVFWGIAVPVICEVSSLHVTAMKAVAQRLRPDSAYGWHNSFPSGHTTLAALMATLVALLLLDGWLRVLPAAYALLMAWSRTQLHAHWLSDVLAGVALGFATGVLLVLVAGALRAALPALRAHLPGVHAHPRPVTHGAAIRPDRVHGGGGQP